MKFHLSWHLGRVRTLLPLFALLLYLVPEADALSSDLNRDGVVDFDDFFLFADEFGLTGEPDADTVVVVLRDTVFIDPADTVTRSGTPITFADPTVEFVLRALVGVAEGDLLTGDVDGITTLNLSGLNISLLDGLQHFTSLTTLSLTDNLIVDLSPLQGLANLKTVTLAANEVRDIEPLVDNPALAIGSSVILVGNPLSILSRTTYVTTMQARGATVTADAFAVTFADSVREVAVRAALMQPTGDLLHLDLETVTTLDVAADSIADLSVLLGMGALTDVWLEGNPLDSNASDTVIPTLIDRGAFVRF